MTPARSKITTVDRFGRYEPDRVPSTSTVASTAAGQSQIDMSKTARGSRNTPKPSRGGDIGGRKPFGEMDSNRILTDDEAGVIAVPTVKIKQKRVRNLDELKEEVIFDPAALDGSSRKFSSANDRPAALRGTSESDGQTQTGAALDLDTPLLALPGFPRGGDSQRSSSQSEDLHTSNLPSSPAARLSLKRIAGPTQQEENEDDLEYVEEGPALQESSRVAGNISIEMFQRPPSRKPGAEATPSETPSNTSNKENDPLQLYKRQETTPRGRAVPSPPLSPGGNHMVRRRSKTTDEIEHLRERAEDSPATRQRKRMDLKQYDRNLGLPTSEDEDEILVVATTKAPTSARAPRTVKTEQGDDIWQNRSPATFDHVKKRFDRIPSIKAKVARMLSSSMEERSEPLDPPAVDEVQWDDEETAVGTPDPFGFLNTEKKLDLRRRSRVQRRVGPGRKPEKFSEDVSEQEKGEEASDKPSAFGTMTAPAPLPEDTHDTVDLATRQDQDDEDLPPINVAEERRKSTRVLKSAQVPLSSPSSPSSSSIEERKDSARDSATSSSPEDDGLDLSELRPRRRTAKRKAEAPRSKRRLKTATEEQSKGERRKRPLSQFQIMRLKPARKRTDSTLVRTASTASSKRRKNSGKSESVQESQASEEKAKWSSMKKSKGPMKRQLEVGDEVETRQRRLGLRLPEDAGAKRRMKASTNLEADSRVKTMAEIGSKDNKKDEAEESSDLTSLSEDSMDQNEVSALGKQFGLKISYPALHSRLHRTLTEAKRESDTLPKWTSISFTWSEISIHCILLFISQSARSPPFLLTVLSRLRMFPYQ